MKAERDMWAQNGRVSTMAHFWDSGSSNPVCGVDAGEPTDFTIGSFTGFCSECSEKSSGYWVPWWTDPDLDWWIRPGRQANSAGSADFSASSPGRC